MALFFVEVSKITSFLKPLKKSLSLPKMLIKVMELKLTKPICFFDLEATGMHVAKDRIVEISILKVYPNGNKESRPGW